MLDRSTTAASEYGEKTARGRVNLRLRRIVLAVTGVAAIVAIYLSRTYSSLAEFPESSLGAETADAVDSFFNWFTDTFRDLTQAFKDAISWALLNPMQELLAESPWWLAGAAIVGPGRRLRRRTRRGDDRGLPRRPPRTSTSGTTRWSR